jgi:ubiquinone/menaquinone biosynthesis C-methylase UbiE
VFKNRLIQPEILDHLPPDQARLNLADLTRINSRFGGHSVLRKSLRKVVNGSRPFTLLDIGSASGDAARVIGEVYPGSTVTSLDCNAVNIENAPDPKVLADAFQLPFQEESFDYVFCSLFLHHFTDEQVVFLLTSFYRIARKALLVSDLERHLIPYLFLPASRPFFRWHFAAVHDGIISVRAAFRREELLDLFRRACIGDAQVEVHRPAFRLSAIATKITE